MHQAPLTAALVAVAFTVAALNDGARAQDAPGAIEGRVIFDGTPPAPTAVIEAGSSQPVLYVDRSGGLQYAVVFLPDARAEGSPPETPATMNQQQYIFVPQVLAVRAGQSVRFTNDDPANHNVHSSDGNRANSFNMYTGSGAAPAEHRFVVTPPDRPVQLSCDIHPSMVAWIYVFDHSQFAVSASGGQYRIENVPPGRHRLSVRQPAGKLERGVAVDVKAGETTRTDVRFTSADLGMPSR